MRLTALLLLLAPLPVAAQTVTTSREPEAVKVSVYRDPSRGDRPINPRWPSGFALITETRTIDIPAGEGVIRFEGVADSALSESAIVTGLPGGVEQKNRDAALLSPAALIEFALGKRVFIRRTDTATGAVREEEAIIRAGPDSGVVVESAAGVEALRCSGLPESLVFDRVPPSLSDKPVLSVVTSSDRAQTATVTLSYLAGGFDWGANYIARLAPDGKTMDLFAWATLANGNGQSFADAETNTIAGRLNRTSANSSPTPPAPMLELGCWPMGTTSDIEENIAVTGSRIPPPPMAPPPPPPPPPAPVAMAVSESRMMAQQEELGDLKLYRIPEPVTVAARSQKQVAMIDRQSVRVEHLLSYRIAAASSMEKVRAPRLIRTENDKAHNLGLALPSGTVRLFTTGGDRPMFAGRATLGDHAVGEEVEIETGRSNSVLLDNVRTDAGPGGRGGLYRTRISNASSRPERVEVHYFDRPGGRLTRPSSTLGRKDGMPLWVVTVPANGTAELSYSIVED